MRTSFPIPPSCINLRREERKRETPQAREVTFQVKTRVQGPESGCTGGCGRSIGKLGDKLCGGGDRSRLWRDGFDR